MRRARLKWIAVGAGIASVAFLAAQVWDVSKADARHLFIVVAPQTPEQDLAIAAVGECIGRFDVEMPADGFSIVVPLTTLVASDFVCLTEKLAPVRHSMGIREEGVRPN